MNAITVTTPSRLHFSLIDLNGEIGRIDGGFGVAICNPNFKIFIERAKQTVIFGTNDTKTYEEILKILSTIKKKYDIKNEYKISLKSEIPRHSGFGSTTQLNLAIASAILKLEEIFLSPYEIATIIKRGGTSGIGVKAFESGGFIVDIGHKFGKNKEKATFIPSSVSDAKPAKILFRQDFPDDWIFVCAVQKSLKIYAESEVEIFKKYCPVNRRDVEMLSHLLLMKILPAVIERDIENFGDGLKDVQSLGFKRIEVEISGLKNFIDKLNKISYGAGLSSFGPCVYALTKGKKHAEEVANYLNEKNIKNFICMPDNKGVYFEYF
ncbi:conserved hypothetical protein [groundwater metagenome]|uniref:Uncharacterized protein n=1 Tax=groundwater metagenome TaxID=717931 RepID=A0A098E622_9ZZZZ